MSLVDSILEIKNRCRLAEEIGREYQLGQKEIACIIEVGKGDGVCSKNLSGAIDLSPSRGSRVINRLVERGLLESSPCRGDKRFIELSLTLEGEMCLDAVERRKQECEREILSHLDRLERTKVEDGLNLLLRVL